MPAWFWMWYYTWKIECNSGSTLVYFFNMIRCCPCMVVLKTVCLFQLQCTMLTNVHSYKDLYMLQPHISQGPLLLLSPISKAEYIQQSLRWLLHMKTRDLCILASCQAFKDSMYLMLIALYCLKPLWWWIALMSLLLAMYFNLSYLMLVIVWLTGVWSSRYFWHWESSSWNGVLEEVSLLRCGVSF